MRFLDLRRLYLPVGTFGDFTEGAEHVCKTVERPNLDNQPEVSCIPEGTYIAKREPLSEHPHLRKIIRPASLDSVFILQNVTDRTGIAIHNANIPTQVEGCIGLGAQFVDNLLDGLPGVTSSDATLAMFMERYEGEDELTITIHS